MKADNTQREIVASYSALKVGAWIALVVTLSASTLIDGASRGWAIPEGRYGWLFPEAVAGSILGLICSAALSLNFALARGVAIARIDDAFVLYFPFGRKRVALERGVIVTSTERELETPAYGISPWPMKTPPKVVVHQVTIHRPGQADVNFRTGLLRDRPDAIAQRMTALIPR